ncbi:extensin-like [Girardinichthys multiradiatus]|uniref:extensin-like n=1 Tax=Girardinichthys multiradiatus TaxID=208333 RepID=UPI001FAD2BE1|nr:extensin-like [Girardinichthys multiradiatus]
MAKSPAPCPPFRTTNIHAKPSKNNRTNPSRGSPRANATATPHILPYIGRGTVKTKNPKHRPPTRNQPADKETPPQYKAEKPDATAEPSDARPAAPTPGGVARKKTHNEANKRQKAHTAKIKTHQQAETSPPRDQPGQSAQTMQTPPTPFPRQNQDWRQKAEPRLGTRIPTRMTQVKTMPIPTHGQPPTSTPEENLHQHLKVPEHLRH